MGMSRLTNRRTFTWTLAFAAAAVVTSGISPVAQAAGDEGVLRLQMGAANQFIFQPPAGATDPFLTQAFYMPGKGSCLLEWTNGYAGLVTLTTKVGTAGGLIPGFGPTSIGAFDGPKGTPCSRVSQYASEALTLTLGPDTILATSAGGSIDANAFDRLELDLEVKGDAHLLLTMRVAGSITGYYELRTGTSITAAGLPPKIDGQPQESDPAHRIVNCSSRSDSGPDSGPNDNCRWIINDLGQSFTITPLVGEFSLEGGADWPAPQDYANNTLIYLTSVEEGDLYCGGSTVRAFPIGDGSNGAQCGPVTRSPSSYCSTVPIHYVYRDIDGFDRGCELIKSPGSQLAALVTIDFPKEPRTELSAVPPTRLRFAGSTADFLPKLCIGTVVGTGDLRTIDEVLKGTLPGVTPNGALDQVRDNGAIDWGCVLEHHVEYLGTSSMQVRQTILFWGDIQIIRH